MRKFINRVSSAPWAAPAPAQGEPAPAPKSSIPDEAAAFGRDLDPESLEQGD